MNTTCTICGLTFTARNSYGLCPIHCTRDTLREYDRVETTARHAKRHNILCSLTLLEWLSALSDYYGECAFCREYTANVIAMYDAEQGYTYANVIPACKACHTLRKEGMTKAEERVHVYLLSSRPIRLFRDMQEETPVYE